MFNNKLKKEIELLKDEIELSKDNIELLKNSIELLKKSNTELNTELSKSVRIQKYSVKGEITAKILEEIKLDKPSSGFYYTTYDLYLYKNNKEYIFKNFIKDTLLFSLNIDTTYYISESENNMVYVVFHLDNGTILNYLLNLTTMACIGINLSEFSENIEFKPLKKEMG